MSDERCRICGGAGRIRRRVPVGHVDFGRDFPCLCRRSELEQKYAKRLREEAGVSLLTVERSTFGLFDPGKARPIIGQDGRVLVSQAEAQESLDHAKRRAMEFAAYPDGWLVMIGGPGAGKSHLAFAVVGACFENPEPIPVHWSSVPQMLDTLRGSYEDSAYDKMMEALQRVRVLVLDDMGTENLTPWAEEKLFMLLNHRWGERLPTVITTNMALHKGARFCRKEYGLDGRIHDRLTDQGLLAGKSLVLLKAGSYRTG